MLKLQIDWQEHFLSHWKALEKIIIIFLTCLIVTVILSKAKDQEKGGRIRWGGGAYQWTLLFKGNKVVYQLPKVFISQDLKSNSPYCLLYCSCDISLETLVLDQLIIP